MAADQALAAQLRAAETAVPTATGPTDNRPHTGIRPQRSHSGSPPAAPLRKRTALAGAESSGAPAQQRGFVIPKLPAPAATVHAAAGQRHQPAATRGMVWHRQTPGPAEELMHPRPPPAVLLRPAAASQHPRSRTPSPAPSEPPSEPMWGEEEAEMEEAAPHHTITRPPTDSDPDWALQPAYWLRPAATDHASALRRGWAQHTGLLRDLQLHLPARRTWVSTPTSTHTQHTRNGMTERCLNWKRACQRMCEQSACNLCPGHSAWSPLGTSA